LETETFFGPDMYIFNKNKNLTQPNSSINRSF